MSDTSPLSTLRAGEDNLYIFARFHARDGAEEKVVEAMREMLPPVRAEPGCISIAVFRSVRDGGLFYLHSRWVDEGTFDLHGTLPHTRHFIQTVEALIDHPLDVARVRPLEGRR